MYVKTEKDKILNLNYFTGVGIEQPSMHQEHQLKAFITQDSTGYSGFTIATFSTEEEAISARDDLFNAIKSGNRSWDAHDFKDSDDIVTDEHWTTERFKELIPEEFRGLYESRNQIERLCEFGVDLMHLVQEEEWKLTHKFNKYYFALYFRSKRVFGIHLFGDPRLVVSLPDDVIYDLNDEWLGGECKSRNYSPSHRWAIYPERATVANLKAILEFAYFWHAGLIV